MRLRNKYNTNLNKLNIKDEFWYKIPSDLETTMSVCDLYMHYMKLTIPLSFAILQEWNYMLIMYIFEYENTVIICPLLQITRINKPI